MTRPRLFRGVQIKPCTFAQIVSGIVRDIMAMGALCAADELGLRVPQDISVIGYDNVRNSRFFTPALTTIHQPKDSLGETAFNMLMDRIVNKREESQSIEVHPRLIERRSVADGPFRDYRR